MYRAIFYIGLSSTIFCLLGLLMPRSISVLTFMFPNGISALVNLALSLILMHFSVASYFRQRKYKLGFGIFGLIWLSLATLGIFYTTYFGLLKSNMAAGNIIIMLVLAIGYLIASLEYDRVGLVEELNISNLSYSIRLIKALRRKSSSAT